MIERHDPNLVGRDFVIGDLHGMYQLFEKLLKHLSFDGSVDRMFSVGDLVDRGPDSMRCLELLYEPWFHAVTSNHEQMMIQSVLYKDRFWSDVWFHNGGHWGSLEDQQLLLDAAKLASKRPYLITIEQADGSLVHVIHAELPPGPKLTDADLADEERVRQLSTIQSHDGEYFTWGRHIFSQFYGVDVRNRLDKLQRATVQRSTHFPLGPDLGMVVSGHTPVQAPVCIRSAGGGQLNIDTGAFMEGDRNWAGLTCLELGTMGLVRVKSSGVAQVQSVLVNMHDEPGASSENATGSVN